MPQTLKGLEPPPAGVTWRGLPLEVREAMIREAAYYLAKQRGFAPGRELDDWLAAEAAIDRDFPCGPAPDAPIQQSSVLSPGVDDALKRIVRQHPAKAIPEVEGIEPELAPSRE
ncbi:DUF2934 domain-containing protein [Thiobacter aerophilum]|uniref:DUF2934 domain-containing protein n=1 Tax=Thiobacter aerophilum TaxID=3121275 RepID=A0ABV0EBN3_9BURK